MIQLALAALIACAPTNTTSPPRSDPPADWWRGESGWCGQPLTAEHIEEAIRLGRGHILHNQLPNGAFAYEYDWRTQEYSPGDNEVRQAGTFWGLASAHREQPTPETLAALGRAAAFWHGQEVTAPDGRRWVQYDDSRRGPLGTLALVALGHIELLRAAPVPEAPLPDSLDRARLQASLDGYLLQIVATMREDGLFAGRMDLETGTPMGSPSPYSDGEALLALVKAARYLDRSDLWPVIERAAEQGYQLNVLRALEKHPDSDTTKGYYQWASMSWYEMLGSGRPGMEVYGDRLLDLAVWMIDTHRTLQRTRNTAYAYEGIVPAYAVAVERGDPRAAKLGCVVQLGLRKLASWQLGHPLALPYVARAPAEPRLLGGVQNKHNESLLRIDVVQHQTHAFLLARELWAPHQPGLTGRAP